VIYHDSFEEELSQGDILQEVRILVDVEGIENNQPQYDNSSVIILSRNCEISKPARAGNSILVARVIPLALAPKDKQGNIRSKGTVNTYYLPAYENLIDECFIDWRTFQPVHKSYLYWLRANRLNYRCTLNKEQIKLCLGGFIWFLTKPDDEENN